MITENGLILKKEKDRIFYKCTISNENTNAVVALVGLCPGYTQLKYVIDQCNSGINIEEARKAASFRGSSRNISRMLRKIKLDRYIHEDIDDEYDFNRSRYFLTTSILKYPGLKKGEGRSDDFNPLAYEFGRICITNIFLKEMLNKNIKKIIIFGKKAENAIKNHLINETPVEQIFLMSGKEIIYLPHPSGSNNGGVARFLS